MKILHTRTLRGPNYWSIRRPKLVVVRLDLEKLADRPSDTLPGFYDGLVQVLPSLEEHHCSPGCRGGFLSRVQDGTMMGHIVEHGRADNAALAPNPSDGGQIKLPVILRARRGQHAKALVVTEDLACDQRAFQVRLAKTVERHRRRSKRGLADAARLPARR